MLDTPVALLVGPEKRVFYLHRGLLCSVSDYFNTALHSGFKETEEQKIELPEEDPEVVERFQLWLYTKSILDHDETVQNIDYPIYVDLYVFAESRLIPKLQNEAINAIIRKGSIDGTISTNSAIYRKTIDSSPIRRLTVDRTVRLGALNTWGFKSTNEDNLLNSKDYLQDVVVALYEEKKGPKETDFWKIRCNYHVHSEDNPPCSES